MHACIQILTVQNINIISLYLFTGLHGTTTSLQALNPAVVSSDNGGATLKYGGGDTFSDFVTLVCQEAQNSQQNVCMPLSLCILFILYLVILL